MNIMSHTWQAFIVKLPTHTIMCRLAFPFSTRNTPPRATGFSPYLACKAFLRHDIKFSSPVRQLAFTSKTWNTTHFVICFNLSITIIRRIEQLWQNLILQYISIKLWVQEYWLKIFFSRSSLLFLVVHLNTENFPSKRTRVCQWFPEYILHPIKYFNQIVFSC